MMQGLLLCACLGASSRISACPNVIITLHSDHVDRSTISEWRRKQGSFDCLSPIIPIST
jgi:hypothetical protein